MDLIIKNGLVVTPNSTKITDIGIKDGKIVAIQPLLSDAKNIIDASNKVVTPGMIDAHVHISQPGRTQWEGYITGTSAAAKGGVTSFIEMPLNQLPCTENVDTLNQKLQSGQGQLKVDVFLLSALTPNNIDDLEDMDQAGVIGYKAFLTKSGDYSIEGEMHHVDDYSLLNGMHAISKTNKPLMIHAENDDLVQRSTQEALKNNVDNYIDFEKYRSSIIEEEAISRAILFSKETSCPIHICHVSSTKGLELIIKAKQEGVDITCETTTHYLAMDIEKANQIGTFAKCAPPIRDKDNMERLWNHLFNGDIEFVVSDHSPCTIDLKQKPFMDAWGGISGLQNVYDLLYSEAVINRKMDLNHFVNITATNVAKRFNIKNKGSIEIGNDADLCIIDPNQSYTIQEEDYEYKNKFSAYTNFKVNCQIDSTFSKGRLVYSKESGVTDEFNGEFILSP